MSENKKESPIEEPDEEYVAPMGCGILGEYPVVSVLFFAVTGIATGVGLTYWEDDGDTKSKLVKWLGLVGDLYLNALKALVLPLVFVTLTTSVIEMLAVGKASVVGMRTIGLYLATTVIAASVGVIWTAIFQGQFTSKEFEPAPPAEVTLGCGADGTYLTMMDDGSVSCAVPESKEDSLFLFDDVNGIFSKKSSGPASVSLSDTVYDGFFMKLVTKNIFASFANASFSAVVIFAIAFGIAVSRSMLRLKKTVSIVMDLFKELEIIFLTMINWVIMVTPFAVWSMIVKNLGGRSDLKDMFANVGWLVLTTIMAMITHYLVVDWGLFYAITKKNPWSYMKNIIPAQTMAFACASSAATVPVTLRSVKATGFVSDVVARFVIPLGATVNMDGGAIYFPCACIWLAILNGITPNAGEYVLLIFIATIGSAGTAPVPSASLVLIVTAYNNVFNTEGTPDGFALIFVIDWFMDRLRTTLNVTGDAVVTGMVAALAGESTEDLESAEVGISEDRIENAAKEQASTLSM